MGGEGGGRGKIKIILCIQLYVFTANLILKSLEYEI